MKIMSEVHGWTGKILRVDLSTGKSSEVDTMQYAEKYIGARGILARIAWEELTPDIGAFDPENEVIFITGPLAGHLVPGASRGVIGGISPQTYPTEDFTRSQIGGILPAELKYAGYDGFIISGKSPNPVYIYITNGKVEIRDASKYWGMLTYITQESIRKDLGDPHAQIMCIGPAGENLNRAAVIVHGDAAVAGQGGFGAVMGSKNLKAIVVVGKGYLKPFDPVSLMGYGLEVSNMIYNPDDRPEVWSCPVSYHRTAWSFMHKWGMAGYDFVKQTRKAQACFGCPQACRIRFVDPETWEGRGSGACCNQCGWYMRLENAKYGKITIPITWRSAKLADGLGLNAFDLLAACTWIVNCLEAGVLTEEETGLKLDEAGDWPFAKKICELSASREGFGKYLIEGTARGADMLGKGHEQLSLCNRGFQDHWKPRIEMPTALFWATDNRHPISAIHQVYWPFKMATQAWNPKAGWATPEVTTECARSVYGSEGVVDNSNENFYNPIHAFVAYQAGCDAAAAKDSTALCDYGPYPMYISYYALARNKQPVPSTPEIESRLFTMVTGTDYMVNREDVRRVGERIITLERAIMTREGRTREDDTHADYYYDKEKKDELTTGPGGEAIKVTRKLDRDKFQGMLDEYYRLFGWDKTTGWPTRARLEELDLKDVADELENLGKLPG